MSVLKDMKDDDCMRFISLEILCLVIFMTWENQISWQIYAENWQWFTYFFCNCIHTHTHTHTHTYIYKIDFLIQCKWCTDLASHRDYLHMLVRCEKIQKDLQVGDATWFVSKLHKELEHVLKRFTCIMAGKHVRNIQQTCSLCCVERVPTNCVPSCCASGQLRSRSRLMSSRRARYGPLRCLDSFASSVATRSSMKLMAWAVEACTSPSAELQ